MIPVSMLADQHLIAETREIKMLPKALQRSLRAKVPLVIPMAFTLNKGHGKFFYNKLRFIKNRYEELKKENIKRGFRFNDVELLDGFPEWCYGDYKPDAKAMAVNIERIKLRISDKPHWYRYYGKSKNWEEMYSVWKKT